MSHWPYGSSENGSDAMFLYFSESFLSITMKSVQLSSLTNEFSKTEIDDRNIDMLFILADTLVFRGNPSEIKNKACLNMHKILMFLDICFHYA